MSNPAKAKGTAHESAVVRYLNERAIPARRVAQTGALDVGDVHGIDPFVGQAKNYRDLATALRDGVDGAVVQAKRVGADRLPVAFIKRPRKGVADVYAVMPLSTFADVLLRLEQAEANAHVLEQLRK
ncbi:RusA-like Holliday junction resolvase [Microbacterium phage phiMiGM15]